MLFSQLDKIMGLKLSRMSGAGYLFKVTDLVGFSARSELFLCQFECISGCLQADLICTTDQSGSIDCLLNFRCIPCCWKGLYQPAHQQVFTLPRSRSIRSPRLNRLYCAFLCIQLEQQLQYTHCWRDPHWASSNIITSSQDQRVDSIIILGFLYQNRRTLAFYQIASEVRLRSLLCQLLCTYPWYSLYCHTVWLESAHVNEGMA